MFKLNIEVIRCIAKIQENLSKFERLKISGELVLCLLYLYISRHRPAIHLGNNWYYLDLDFIWWFTWKRNMCLRLIREQRVRVLFSLTAMENKLALGKRVYANFSESRLGWVWCARKLAIGIGCYGWSIAHNRSFAEKDCCDWHSPI